jgi:Na+/proline symporter
MYGRLETEYTQHLAAREQAARAYVAAHDRGDETAARDASTLLRATEDTSNAIRSRALAMAHNVTGQSSVDANYIIPRFVLGHLPIGLAGIFVAAVIAAAMNAISGELNSLSTTTVFDFYRRWIRADAADEHFVTVSRFATAFWGVFACIVATYAANLGSLIVVVNTYGSFFYGSILGVFVLAMMKWVRGTPAFLALITGMLAVAAVNRLAPTVAFLWYNVVGAVTVVIVGVILSAFLRGPRAVASS